MESNADPSGSADGYGSPSESEPDLLGTVECLQTIPLAICLLLRAEPPNGVNTVPISWLSEQLAPLGPGLLFLPMQNRETESMCVAPFTSPPLLSR